MKPAANVWLSYETWLLNIFSLGNRLYIQIEKPLIIFSSLDLWLFVVIETNIQVCKVLSFVCDICHIGTFLSLNIHLQHW